MKFLSNNFKRYQFIFFIIVSLISNSAFSQTGIPLINISEDPDGQTQYSLTLQVLILMTALTLLPSLILVTRPFGK